MSPQSHYGQSFTAISVSTNGFVKMGGAATTSDLGESSVKFTSGTVGGGPVAPAIAVLWEDLDMGNVVPGQRVEIFDQPTQITVSWLNGDYFPATPFGTIACTIDKLTGRVVMDYSLYTAVTPPTEGIVGVSDGLTVGAVANEIDLVTAGAVNFFGPINPAETVFQNFAAGSLFTETVDLAGLTLNFTDLSTLGNYTLF